LHIEFIIYNLQFAIPRSGDGAYPELQAFVHPQLLLIQVVGAIGGGMAGTLLARRANQDRPPEPEYTPLV
jgi:hypothetical protein